MKNISPSNKCMTTTEPTRHHNNQRLICFSILVSILTSHGTSLKFNIEKKHNVQVPWLNFWGVQDLTNTYIAYFFCIQFLDNLIKNALPPSVHSSMNSWCSIVGCPEDGLQLVHGWGLSVNFFKGNQIRNTFGCACLIREHPPKKSRTLPNHRSWYQILNETSKKKNMDCLVLIVLAIWQMVSGQYIVIPDPEFPMQVFLFWNIWRLTNHPA